MSATALRPQGVGDIVDRVLALYRANPALLVSLAAIPYLVLAIAGSVPLLLTRQDLGPILAAIAGDAPPDLAARVLALVPYFAFLALLSVAVFAVQSAALVDATAARYLGRAATVGASLRVALRVAPRLIGAALLGFVALIAIPVVVIVAAMLTGIGLLIGLGSLAAFAILFYLALSWVIVPMVATLEGAGPLDALRRSLALVRGARWRVFVLLVLLSLLQLVLSSVFSLLLLGSIFSSDLVRALVQQGINYLVGIFWAPLQWGTFTVFYYDLRVRREAYDLQLAAEALPRGV